MVLDVAKAARASRWGELAMTKIDGVTAIAIIVIASFSIDWIFTTGLFLLSGWPAFSRFFPDPTLLQDARARSEAERRRKLLYFVVAFVLGVALAVFGGVRLLAAVGFQTTVTLDVFVTGLILAGGSDRIAEILKAAGLPSAVKEPARPIEITGRLILEQEPGKSIVPSRGRISEDAPGASLTG